MLKIKVGVIFGGRSVEHEVSVISALQVMHALDGEKYQVMPLYISKQGVWHTGEALKELGSFRDMPRLLAACQKVLFSANRGEAKVLYDRPASFFRKAAEERLDVAFPVIHGTYGEDGCLQGLLELSGIPYVGAGVTGSAVGMDKIVMKAVLEREGLPLVNYRHFYAWEMRENSEKIISALERDLKFPLIVKPANLGSSIGISRAKDARELAEAIDLAARFAQRIVVEDAVEPLREINCSVLGDTKEQEVSCCEEPIGAHEILSFQDKYLGGGKGMGGAARRIPAPISEELSAHIRELARRSFKALDGCGVCRMDFLLNSKSGQVYVNEINTIPGSLSFYLWEPAGLGFPKLLDKLIALALKRSREQEKLIYSYDSNILAGGGRKNGKF
ncbi:MAG: D-alanine--D-alanine ligase [Clostridiales bacterium]|nr:D-alanine--D-alanine ligase [Clostridiales bacterium]